MLITLYDSYNVLSKVYSKGSYLKMALNETLIEELNRSKVTKICYGVLDKDITLSYIIKSLCDKNPKLAVRTILKIALYMIIYLNKQPYAVTDNAVELLSKLGKGGMKGFVNAVLRKYIREGYKMPTNELEKLSIKYSYPLFAIKMLKNDYGIEELEKIISYDNSNTFIRFNDGENGKEYLQKLNIDYYKTPFENVFLANGFKMDDGFYLGKYTFQNVGSVAICDIVEKGETLLDTCSAPGGKSVNLSSKFNKIIATELHSHRAELITSYINRMNKTNIEVLVRDMTNYISEFDSRFDAVLLDSPCSGYGVLNENPDIKLNRTEQDIINILLDQQKLLKNASKYVKVGGYLYYSTCSIFSIENTKQIEKFLQENQNYIEEKITSKLPYIASKKGIQFLPHISMGAGFYVCKLKRIK